MPRKIFRIGHLVGYDRPYISYEMIGVLGQILHCKAGPDTDWDNDMNPMNDSGLSACTRDGDGLVIGFSFI